MQRTFVDRVSEYYKRRDDEFSLSVWPSADAKENVSSYPVSNKQSPSRLPKRLLVVDDEMYIRNAYVRIFEKQGFEVLTASNAMEANEVLLHEHVDIVFLDINMAEVDGVDFFEAVRCFHKKIKVVVSSVYPIDDQRERIKGADAYFDKSDGKDVLLSLALDLI